MSPQSKGVACSQRAPGRYRRREPEQTVLHQVVREQLETFLARRQDQGRPVPRFVERELRSFLECGILAHGFVRVHCDACGKDRVVGFSCKGRGFCSSCGGRRMADTAAWLVDRVLPEVPVRQWVFTVPFPLRFRMAYDAPFTSEMLRILVRAVFASLRRRAQKYGKMPRAECGAVTFVQRFGDALNLNVHFHTLVLDGVYEVGHGATRFHVLPPPEGDELERILRRIVRRVGKLLERRGMESDAELLAEDQPLLTGLAAASIRSRIATGRRAGQEVLRRGDRIDPEDMEPQPARSDCVAGGGFSLHAGVAVPARDRKRLERLCRYVARPPVATERLSRLGDGRLLYRLKRRWRDGSTHMIFEPQELLEKLVSLVPPPRAHQVRYHGVLAPCASRRAGVIPQSPRFQREKPLDSLRPPGEPAAPATPASLPGIGTMAAGNATDRAEAPSEPPRPPRHGPPGAPRRLSWAELMRRVFAVDVLECSDCGGRMRILAAIHNPDAVRAILESLGLPSRPPPNLPAQPTPDDDLFA
jgi:hypothetical protein